MVGPPEASDRGARGEPVTGLGCWLTGALPGDIDSYLVGHGIRPRTDAVAAARRFAAATVRRWGLGHLADTVALAVSELVTNALRHGLAGDGDAAAARRDGRREAHCPVNLFLRYASPQVTCVVTDPGDTVPIWMNAGELEDSGRGLHVLSACSSRWGCAHLQGGGKAVWAVFEPDERSGGRC